MATLPWRSYVTPLKPLPSLVPRGEARNQAPFTRHVGGGGIPWRGAITPLKPVETEIPRGEAKNEPPFVGAGWTPAPPPITDRERAALPDAHAGIASAGLRLGATVPIVTP